MEEFILCSGKTHLTKWLNWWDNRRNHVMEVFQPVSAPSTNLAEASHASMKLSGGTGLNIVQSAIYDISECFKFEKSIEGYCLGYAKSGTGPSKALKTSRMEKRTLKNIDELMTELDGQYHSGEQGPSRVTLASFQPNESSSHRADKGKDPDKRPEGRKRTVKSTSFNNSLEKASELGQFKIVDVEQYSPTEACVTYSYKSHEIRRIISKLRNHTKVSKDKSTNLLPHSNYESAKSSKELKLSMAKYTKDNLYEITFLSGLISKCYGCEKTFSPEDKNPPYDIVIRHLEIRPGYNREKNEWFVTKDKKTSKCLLSCKGPMCENNSWRIHTRFSCFTTFNKITAFRRPQRKTPILWIYNLVKTV
ncbi:unnamed protein product [Mytilus coruscus]|uniref:Uncharacterized protein n=1 Tax=Mytilus coruscus TaxID=42192 RepID=A0A6J8DGB4_MYTCO|nr:unnamed protein product [Mytilus coruscus]